MPTFRTHATAMIASAVLLLPAVPAFADDILLPAKKGCVDAGVNVSAGERIAFSAIGTATYGGEGSPVNDSPVTNPDGERFLPYIPVVIGGKNKPINGLFSIGKKIDPHAIYPGPIGALVGTIGDKGKAFFIGAENTVTMPRSGRLILCYNDVPNLFSDNTGGYKVTFY